MKRNIQTTSGVYGIYSPTNLLLYVGCSKNLNNRYSTHLNELLFNKHPNKELQEFSNLYGLGNLEFKIINFCDDSDLLYYESIFIKIFNPICNKLKTEKGSLDDFSNLYGEDYDVILEYIKKNNLPKMFTTTEIKNGILEYSKKNVSNKKIAKVLQSIGYTYKRKSNGRFFYKC